MPENSETRFIQWLQAGDAAAEVDRCAEVLIAVLDNEIRTIAELRLFGHGNREFAGQFGCIGEPNRPGEHGSQCSRTGDAMGLSMNYDEAKEQRR